MQIQWYPGHMTKAKRAMKEDIKLIDLVIELVDARVPLGAATRILMSLRRERDGLVLLNKADLADDGCTERGSHGLRSRASMHSASTRAAAWE